MECRRPTSRDLNAALSAMQFQISPLKMEAAGVNRSANSAEYTRWNGYLWRKAAVRGLRPKVYCRPSMQHIWNTTSLGVAIEYSCGGTMATSDKLIGYQADAI